MLSKLLDETYWTGGKEELESFMAINTEDLQHLRQNLDLNYDSIKALILDEVSLVAIGEEKARKIQAYSDIRDLIVMFTEVIR